jgi:hypothetical protein
VTLVAEAREHGRNSLRNAASEADLVGFSTVSAILRAKADGEEPDEAVSKRVAEIEAMMIAHGGPNWRDKSR